LLQGAAVDLRLSKFFATLKSFWGLVRETFAEWSKDRATTLGAALAFYTIFSLAPLLIIITVVVGYFFGQAEVQADLLARLTQFVGKENALNLMTIIQDTYKPGSSLFATAIALFLMLLGSSTVFLMLKSALNDMWGVTSPETGLFYLVLNRLQTFVVVMIVGFLLFVSMVIKSLLAAFFHTVSRFLVVPALLLEVGDHVLSLLFITMLFTVLYKVLPDAKVPWRFAFRGAFVTALLFSIGNVFVGLYLTHQSIGSAYGAAGSLVVMLMWVYYSALIVFLGAEFAQVYARHHGQEMERKESLSLGPEVRRK
jgi:membrane protein